MPLMLRLPLTFAAIVLLCLVTSSMVLAQSAQLILYAFNEGVPVENLEILLDDELIALSNEYGVAELAIEPGIHYLEIRLQDSVVLDQQILAIADEFSQWIVDVTGGGSAIYDVESSSPLAAGAAVAAQTTTASSDRVPGIIEGRLLRSDDGKPVENARIFISGVSTDIRSGPDGRFSAEVPAGRRSVSVLHSGFNTRTRDNIEVTEGGTVSLEIELTPAGSELPEYVVVVPHISGSLASVLEERREEVAVANILGAEQISKAGDSDAAGALKRVTGLTLVGGRFIFVRGLGERYSSTLLNGANVPSPDPTRRVVPLDLFPAGSSTALPCRRALRRNYRLSSAAELCNCAPRPCRRRASSRSKPSSATTTRLPAKMAWIIKVGDATGAVTTTERDRFLTCWPSPEPTARGLRNSAVSRARAIPGRSWKSSANRCP